MYGPRSKIPSKNVVRQRCADEFNSGIKRLIHVFSLSSILFIYLLVTLLLSFTIHSDIPKPFQNKGKDVSVQAWIDLEASRNFEAS
jgi:hypothetical protein